MLGVVILIKIICMKNLNGLKFTTKIAKLQPEHLFQTKQHMFSSKYLPEPSKLLHVLFYSRCSSGVSAPTDVFTDLMLRSGKSLNGSKKTSRYEKTKESARQKVFLNKQYLVRLLCGEILGLITVFLNIF